VIVGLGAAVLAPASLAYGHDHERPELKAWFQRGNGSTCLRMPSSNNETSMALRWCGGLHSTASMGQ
jgi:hypothetical protein